VLLVPQEEVTVSDMCNVLGVPGGMVSLLPYQATVSTVPPVPHVSWTSLELAAPQHGARCGLGRTVKSALMLALRLLAWLRLRLIVCCSAAHRSLLACSCQESVTCLHDDIG